LKFGIESDTIRDLHLMLYYYIEFWTSRQIGL